MGDDLIHRRELSSSSILGCTLLQEPVIEETKTPSNIAWEYHSVTLSRVPGYGFGIAVSGGRDNPHFANGDPAIAISDVLKSGPAEGKLMVNDRILSANGVSLETVDYATAVQVLRDNSTVQLVVKRRVVLQEGSTVRVSLSRKEGAGGAGKKDFGLVLSTRLYIKDMSLKTGSIGAGDIILKINNTPTDGMSVKEARRLIEATKDKLQLVIKREEQREEPKAYSTQNLYVQPPRRAEFSNGGPREFVPPRPPPPQEDEGQFGPIMTLDTIGYPSSPRHISFVKHGSVGIRLAGGNSVGIYVTAVQPGSPASAQGLVVGDQILKVNSRDLTGMTREEAVELLMSLNDTVDLLVQSKVENYKKILEESVGDNFYVRCNYDHGGFKAGDILNITDSLSGGGVGEWLAVNLRTGVRGGVPNVKRGRELIKKKGAEPYTRVELKRVDFLRPVVIWGAGAEWARAELSKEPGFQIPALDSSKTFKLSNIRDIINTGHHALLDINAAAVEKLNSANIPPIVLFLDMSKDLLRDLRNKSTTGWRSLTVRSLKKMMEAGSKQEKADGHLISAKVSLASNGEGWVGRIVSGVEREQGARVWVGLENKPQENYDYLFPPAQPPRSSYAEESDDPEPVLPNYTAPPPYALTTYVQEVYSTRLTTPKTINAQHPPLAHSPTESEQPPQVDRTKKPKSATERLFGDPNRNYYECQHDVYRFTRSTVQGRFENGSSTHSYTPPGLPYMNGTINGGLNGPLNGALNGTLNGGMNGSMLPGPPMPPLNYDSPYLPPPPPKVKPVPPPKPAKPLRSTPRDGDSGFYLNVPITLGNRELSAFELYRKEGSSALVEVSPEAGGRLELEGVRLYLPPGAVADTTIVRMTVYEGEGDPRLLTPLVKLEPEGLVLLQPGTLSLPQSSESMYDNWEGVSSRSGLVELSISKF